MPDSQKWNLPPHEIERRSFAIIDKEAGEHGFEPKAWSIVRRMIHTTGDFDFVQITRIHQKAVEKGVEALKRGKPIFTDTRMAKAGISERRLKPFGVTKTCILENPEVAVIARKKGATRSLAGMDLAVEKAREAIFVIGNAPTALFRLIEHVKAGKALPALVVGMPVGFVNARESKDALAELDIPHITALGRKGGSALAASVINALAVLAGEE